MYTNADNLINKRSKLLTIISTDNPGIICITETLLRHTQLIVWTGPSTPFCCGWVEPPTKCSKRERASQDLSFYNGAAGKEGDDFLQGRVAIFRQKINENLEYLMTKKV